MLRQRSEFTTLIFPQHATIMSEKTVPNQKYGFALCHVTLESELEQKVGWSSVVRSVYCSVNVKRGGRGRKWSRHPRTLGNPGNSGLADQMVHFRRGKWSMGNISQRSNLFIGITRQTHTLEKYKEKPHIDLGGAWLDRQSLIWP